MALSDIFSPGVESILSGVPAIIGAYEQARGRPVGAALSTLGQFGLTNAANRQKKHEDEADVAARIQSLAAQGLTPPQGVMDAIQGTGQPGTGMSPAAAQQELTDIEGRKVAEQQKQQAYQEKIQALQYKAPVYPGNGEKAFKWDAQGNFVRAPEYDKPAGAQAKTETQLFLTNRPKWNELMAAKAHNQITTADTKLLDRANTLLNFKLDKTPVGMIPELKNTVLYDRDTMQPVNPNSVTARQALSPGSRYAFVDRKTGTETIPNLRAGRAELIKLAQYSAAVLPKGTGKPLNDWINTYANRWRINAKALSGGVNEAMFGAERTAAAMQLQKAFTGSTRPVNLVEFTRLTGDASTTHPIDAKDIDAVLPTSRDTREQAQAKLDVLQSMFDNKLTELNMNTGAPGVYFKSVDDAMSAAASSPEAPETPETPAPAEAPTPDDGGFDL